MKSKLLVMLTAILLVVPLWGQLAGKLAEIPRAAFAKAEAPACRFNEGLTYPPMASQASRNSNTEPDFPLSTRRRVVFRHSSSIGLGHGAKESYKIRG
jgi:hypothetical protein